jgi:DNA repair protein RadC
MRPLFPYEFTPKQIGAMLPYKQNLGEISEPVDWLRHSLLYENREEFRGTLEDLRHQLTELEALFSQNSESSGAGS